MYSDLQVNGNSQAMKVLNNIIGLTVGTVKYRLDEMDFKIAQVDIYFTDGSQLAIESIGTEFQWLDISEEI